MSENHISILEIVDLCSSYEDKPLLQKINLSLAEGEILCLLGPSGSGKTTLLKLIAGLEESDSGHVLFQGENITDTPSHKRNFGMMFQEYALFPHKNVRENIAFGLEMMGCEIEEKNRRIAEVLETVDLKGFEHRNIDELSGGERQRVALARSLAPEPRLLLLDEPLGSLDRTLRDRLTGEIRKILKTLGVTAVFVTHDQIEAFSIADRVAILHEGRLEQVDTPENIYRFPVNETVARFLGFINIIQGSIDNGGVFTSSIGKLSLNNLQIQESAKATLLIRPDGAQIYVPNTAEPQENELRGTVRFRQFLGSRYKITLSINESNLTFELPLNQTPPLVDEQLIIKLSSSAMVLLGSRRHEKR